MNKVSRRRFLTGSAAVVVTAGAAGTGWALRPPQTKRVHELCQQEGNVSKRVLVAYATKCGSTGEIAVQVGNVLCSQGLEVDVRPAKTVRSLDGYDAVVLGSAIRMERPIAEARRFVKKYHTALSHMPVAYFAAMMTLHEDTAENRVKAEKAAAPLCVAGEPLSLGLFAGKMDLATLEPFFRMAMGKAEDMPKGDFRDWEAIQAWAAEVAQRLAA